MLILVYNLFYQIELEYKTKLMVLFEVNILQLNNKIRQLIILYVTISCHISQWYIKSSSYNVFQHIMKQYEIK